MTLLIGSRYTQNALEICSAENGKETLFEFSADPYWRFSTNFTGMSFPLFPHNFPSRTEQCTSILLSRAINPIMLAMLTQ